MKRAESPAVRAPFRGWADKFKRMCAVLLSPQTKTPHPQIIHNYLCSSRFSVFLGIFVCFVLVVSHLGLHPNASIVFALRKIWPTRMIPWPHLNKVRGSSVRRSSVELTDWQIDAFLHVRSIPHRMPCKWDDIHSSWDWKNNNHSYPHYFIHEFETQLVTPPTPVTPNSPTHPPTHRAIYPTYLPT